MIGRAGVLRRFLAFLLVVFGLLIVGRGLLEAAPPSFLAMGALMALLGLYRLRQLSQLARR